jgi:hypothetical protein
MFVSSPAALWNQIDPADLRWIYLTHPDRDHTGSLMEILEAAPQAQLVTTFLGMGILSMEYAIPPQRVFLLNPGQSLDVGDRRLTCFRPPLYDSPATTGFYDDQLWRAHGHHGAGNRGGHRCIAVGRPGGGAAAVGDCGQPLGHRRG